MGPGLRRPIESRQETLFSPSSFLTTPPIPAGLVVSELSALSNPPDGFASYKNPENNEPQRHREHREDHREDCRFLTPRMRTPSAPRFERILSNRENASRSAGLCVLCVSVVISACSWADSSASCKIRHGTMRGGSPAVQDTVPAVPSASFFVPLRASLWLFHEFCKRLS